MDNMLDFLYALVALLLLGLPPVSAESSSPFSVCLVQSPGYVNCDPFSDPLTYSGYEVEAFRYIANSIGWIEVSPQLLSNDSAFSLSIISYFFNCTILSQPQVVGILTSYNNTSSSECTIAAGSITVNVPRLRDGAKFSMPTFTTGLGAMILNSGSVQVSKSLWERFSFFQPFSWDLWLAIILTAFFLPVFVWLVENLFLTGTIPYGAHYLWTLLTSNTHASFSQLFVLEGMFVRSWPAMTILTCYNFLIVIILCTYTANLAAIITTNSIHTMTLNNFTSFSSLVGTSVAADSIYVSSLSKENGIYASPIDWEGEITYMKVQDLLISGAISAFISDLPGLQQFIQEHDKGCSLTLLGNDGTQDSAASINPFNYAFSFSAGFSEQLLAQFNMGLITIQVGDKFEILRAQYLPALGSSLCNDISISTADESNILAFFGISGLWLILGAAVALGMLMSLVGVAQNILFNKREIQLHNELFGNEDGHDISVDDDEQGSTPSSLPPPPPSKYNFFHHVSMLETREEIERVESMGLSMVPPGLRKKALDRLFYKKYFAMLRSEAEAKAKARAERRAQRFMLEVDAADSKAI